MNGNAFILVALKILAVLALVLLNGFFVAAEFALATAGAKIKQIEIRRNIFQRLLNPRFPVWLTLGVIFHRQEMGIRQNVQRAPKHVKRHPTSDGVFPNAVVCAGIIHIVGVFRHEAGQLAGNSIEHFNRPQSDLLEMIQNECRALRHFGNTHTKRPDVVISEYHLFSL